MSRGARPGRRALTRPPLAGAREQRPGEVVSQSSVLLQGPGCAEMPPTPAGSPPPERPFLPPTCVQPFSDAHASQVNLSPAPRAGDVFCPRSMALSLQNVFQAAGWEQGLRLPNC